MEKKDPYFCMQDEVIKSLDKAKKAYFTLNSINDVHPLRQIIKNIEWDLIDLEETICVVEKRPSDFQLLDNDIISRRQFLFQTRNIIKLVKNQLNTSVYPKKVIDFTVQPSLPQVSLSNGDCKLIESSLNHVGAQSPEFYTKPNVYPALNDPLSEHKRLLRDQDDRLEELGTSISTLKGMSRRIGDELEDQVMLLDDFSNDMSRTESRLNILTKRTARILHLTTDRRQWCAIFSLSGILILIFILLVIL